MVHSSDHAADHARSLRRRVPARRADPDGTEPGRKLCGRQVSGWQWLDIRALAASLAAEQSGRWGNATIARVIYCTARIDGATNSSGAAEQGVYKCHHL
jgi:hypothetical protein